MREIKFRAWRHNQMIYDVTVGKVGDSYAQILLHWGVKTPNYPEFEGFDRTSILMQYTGLKDKNGKEIYEGDILKHDLWGITYVYWEHGMFRSTNHKNDNAYMDVTMADHQLQRTRIIGNIYENPELIALDKHALTT